MSTQSLPSSSVLTFKPNLYSSTTHAATKADEVTFEAKKNTLELQFKKSKPHLEIQAPPLHWHWA